MRVWVVLEDDRGCGTFVIGVFFKREDAEECAARSSHYFIDGSHVVV